MYWYSLGLFDLSGVVPDRFFIVKFNTQGTRGKIQVIPDSNRQPYKELRAMSREL